MVRACDGLLCPKCMVLQRLRISVRGHGLLVGAREDGRGALVFAERRRPAWRYCGDLPRLVLEICGATKTSPKHSTRLKGAASVGFVAARQGCRGKAAQLEPRS